MVPVVNDGFKSLSWIHHLYNQKPCYNGGKLVLEWFSIHNVQFATSSPHSLLRNMYVFIVVCQSATTSNDREEGREKYFHFYECIFVLETQRHVISRLCIFQMKLRRAVYHLTTIGKTILQDYEKLS